MQPGNCEMMKWATPLLALFVALLCWAPLASSQGRAMLRGPDLVISFDPSLESWAKELQKDYPRLRTQVEKALGWRLSYSPSVFLVSDKDLFEKMSGSPFVSAFALPERRAVVMRVSSTTSRPYYFNETFEHELCHLILHQRIPSDRFPKWLDEGVCQWISGSVGEILEGGGLGAAGAMDLSLRAFPLRTLSRGFPGEKDSLFLAYEESRSIVEFISSRYGREALLDILSRLGKGDDLDAAFHGALSDSLETVEAEWLKEIRGKRVWLIWIGQYLYEVLFFFAAILSIFAFILQWIRKRRYAEEDEGEGDERDDD